MSTTRICCGIVLACVWASSQACDLPKLITIPSADKMSGHEKQVRSDLTAYMAGMNKYVACIKAELAKEGGKDAPPLVQRLLVQRNNVAVAEANAVVASYKKSTGAASEAGPPDEKK
jgi:hypothetical protein